MTLARNFASQGEHDEARALLELIIEDEPGHQDARIALCELYLVHGEAEAALAALEPLLDRSDVDGMALLNVATSFHNLKDLETASHIVRRRLAAQRNTALHSLALEHYMYVAPFDTAVSPLELRGYAEEWTLAVRAPGVIPINPPPSGVGHAGCASGISGRCSAI
jgi:tetratricopeptide (TPR) repeat protein